MRGARSPWGGGQERKRGSDRGPLRRAGKGSLRAATVVSNLEALDGGLRIGVPQRCPGASGKTVLNVDVGGAVAMKLSVVQRAAK